MKTNLKPILLIGCSALILAACASKPNWNNPTGDSRQFYQDEEMCTQRAERAMGNAGQGEPTNDSPAAEAGAAVGNLIGAMVGRSRAMSEYERCMQSMGYTKAD